MATPATDPRTAAPPRVSRARLAAVAALYFASGFPYGALTELLPVYFRVRGVSLEEIGLLGLVSLPYVAKPLWAPLLDRFGTRRGWVAATQVLMAAAFAWIAAGSSDGLGWAVWSALVLVAVLSATQDVAIDALTIELLDEHELGPGNGLRVTAYRAALIAAGGLLVALSARAGWTAVLWACGGVMLALALVTLSVPALTRARTLRASERRPHVAGLAMIVDPVRALLQRPAMLAALLFIPTFKLGDLALQPMVKPFWLDSGYSPAQVGLVLTSLGLGAAIVGALAGGALTARLGTYRALWMLGLVQALSNLGYWLAAVAGAPKPLMYTAALVEQFTGGMGTAAFLTFMMVLCDRRWAATQYALLSSTYRLGGIMASAVSGYLAARMGYAGYFMLTFALAWPAYALLPWVRRAMAGAPPHDEPADVQDDAAA